MSLRQRDLDYLARCNSRQDNPMASSPSDIARLIKEIEDAFPSGNEPKLIQARSLAAEAARTPAGDWRDELVRDARHLLRQGRRS